MVILALFLQFLQTHKCPMMGLHLNYTSIVKDVLMGIPKSDLLDVTVALINVARKLFLANSRGNRPYSFEIRVY